MQTEALYQAVLAAFKLNEAASDDPATTARAITGILAAFAALIAPPVATIEGVSMTADDTPSLILAELRAMRSEIAALNLHTNRSANVLEAVTRGGNALITATR